MNPLALGLDRTGIELKIYAREKESVFFSFLFPIMMLGLFAMIFDKTVGGSGMNAAEWFLPGMVAAGVMLTSFQTLAMSVATERDDGTLKRLRATPTPAVSYFLGKIGLVLVTSTAQLAVLLLFARFALGAHLPDSPGRWLTLAWVFVLGVTCGTTLGIAYSSLIPSARAGTPMVIAPVLVLQFISGVYFVFSDLPGWLQHVASLFPLKWIAQGMRAAFYPDALASHEMAGSWELGRVALVVGAWALAGLFISAATFRFTSRSTR